ncbi:MAG: hypothetical protein LV471_00055 [Nitrosomonas sp.]|nr:hypothetical protein [Nitrosomonas sp.]
MKTGKNGSVTLVAALALVVLALPISGFSAEYDAQFESNAMNNDGTINHGMLAVYYEQHADDLHAKVEEQVEALNHKPRTSFLGRNGQNIKKHVEYKIHEFEKEAEESLKKAAYHKQMAEEQSFRPTFAASDKTKS